MVFVKCEIRAFDLFFKRNENLISTNMRLSMVCY